jgi:acetamidase/formamidase
MKPEWDTPAIMDQNGLAAGQVGETHELTPERQGTYHYTIGPYSEPVMTVQPGDRVVFWTPDCFEGRIQSEDDKPSEILEMPFINPQCGPIMVEGAEKGDAIAVYIESMEPRGDNPRGTCCMIPEFGGLTGTNYTATLNDPLPEIVRKIDVDESSVYWSDRVTLPYKPHVGTISCSPEIDSINALTPDQHGGNMDMPDICPGNIVYLPVKVSGGRFFIGDCHACQGEGEVCGVAVEFPSVTTVRFDVIKNWGNAWPRLETEDSIMTIGSARPLEDATRIAYRELVYWMVSDFGFDKWDAYMMLSQCGRAKLGNFVDPKYTIGAAISKQFLK